MARPCTIEDVRPEGSKLAALDGIAERFRQDHDALCRLDADSRRVARGAGLPRTQAFIEVFLRPMDWSYDEGEKVFQRRQHGRRTPAMGVRA